MTRAAEFIFAVDAFAMETRGRLAIVDVRFARNPGETLGTFACVSGDGIVAYSSVLTWT